MSRKLLVRDPGCWRDACGLGYPAATMHDPFRTLLADTSTSCHQVLAGAVERALAAGHDTVDADHLLAALLDQADGDAALILDHNRISRADLARQLGRALSAKPSPLTPVPAIASQPASRSAPRPSRELADLIPAARALQATFGREAPLRTGPLLLALTEDPALRAGLPLRWPALMRIIPAVLRHDLPTLMAQSPEGTGAPLPSSSQGPFGDALTRWTVDLTAEARAGRLDPVTGREREIAEIITLLARRRQNNPLLLGDAGVGKTAVVEGLALALARGRAPAGLAGASLHQLDLALLQAGAGVRGDFEARLHGVLAAIEARAHPVLLFVDEAHQLVGAGGTAGLGDAASLLKPALARGVVRLIGATTWEEYRRHLEKDAALVRRFQPVSISEPTPEAAEAMLGGLSHRLEDHHGVRIPAEMVALAVRLSHRHMPQRRLPDKAVTVLDTACALTAQTTGDMSHAPPEGGRLPVSESAVRQSVARLAGLEGSALVDNGGTAATVLSLDAVLAEAVPGQETACRMLADHLTARALSLEVGGSGPRGAMLLCGQPGSGRGLVGPALARHFHGPAASPLHLSMADYQESNSIAALRGAPAGYVGHGEGGLLTAAIRRTPQTVLVLTDLERAHPVVRGLIGRILTDGRLEDAQGLVADFRDAILVITTTIPADTVAAAFGPVFAARAVVVPFPPLSAVARSELLLRHLETLASGLRQGRGLGLSWDAGVPDLLASAVGLSPEVANLSTLLDHVVTAPLGRFLDGSPTVRRFHLSIRSDGVAEPGLWLDGDGTDAICLSLPSSQALQPVAGLPPVPTPPSSRPVPRATRPAPAGARPRPRGDPWTDWR